MLGRVQPSRVFLCRDNHFRFFHSFVYRVDMLLVFTTEMVMVGIRQLRDLSLITFEVDDQLVGRGYAREQ